MVSLLFITGLAGCNQANKEEPQELEWRPLFNGKDLSGWDIKIAGHPLNENYRNTFRWQDSLLRISYSEYDSFQNRFGHIYYKTPYSYYKLRFQYRITGEQMADAPVWAGNNSGVMIHSQSALSVNTGQNFPVSVEMQLLCSATGSATPTGNVCTPGTLVHFNNALYPGHCLNSSSKTFSKEQWVSAVAEVYGDSLVRHIINGDTVLTYTKLMIGGGFVDPAHTWSEANITDSLQWIRRANTPLKEGYIALQAESQPVDFRELEILDLTGCMDPSAKNFKRYFVKADNSKCKY